MDSARRFLSLVHEQDAIVYNTSEREANFRVQSLTGRMLLSFDPRKHGADSTPKIRYSPKLLPSDMFPPPSDRPS